MPKRSDLYKTMREHFAKGENREVVEFAELVGIALLTGVAYYVAAALINLGNYASAHEHIKAALEAAVPIPKPCGS